MFPSGRESRRFLARPRPLSGRIGIQFSNRVHPPRTVQDDRCQQRREVARHATGHPNRRFASRRLGFVSNGSSHARTHSRAHALKQRTRSRTRTRITFARRVDEFAGRSTSSSNRRRSSTRTSRAPPPAPIALGCRREDFSSSRGRRAADSFIYDGFFVAAI